jgi:hypothetical protein
MLVSPRGIDGFEEEAFRALIRKSLPDGGNDLPETVASLFLLFISPE